MTIPAVRTRKRASSSTLRTAAAVEDPTGSPLHDNLQPHTEYRAPGDLKPPRRNLRKHGERQLSTIAASIREHGFVNPILVDDESRIVSGHGRWLAATSLGVASVPVIELAHLSPEQLRLYAIADNRIAEQSEFDMDEVRLEFGELENLSLDLNLELTGFTSSELDGILSV